MSEGSCAPFINTTVIENEIGTRVEPYLTNITTGQITGGSVIFHTEENGKHFEYFRNTVSSIGIATRCIYYARPGVKCKATMSLRSDDPTIISKEIRPKNNGNVYRLKKTT